MIPTTGSGRSDGAFRHSLRHYLFILALTLFYFYVRMNQERMVYIALVGIAAFTFMLIMKPDLRFWFGVFLLAIVFGGGGIEYRGFTPNYSTLAAMCLFAGYLFRRMFWKDQPIPITTAGKLVFAAILLQTASILISIHIHQQYPLNAIREGSGMYVMVPLMFMVPDLFRGEEGIERVTKIILVMLLLVGIIGVVQRAASTGFSRVDLTAGYLLAGRFQSTFGDPNQFASFLELVVPMSLAAGMVLRSRRWKVIAYSAFGLGILSVLYTFSRGGFITCILASAVLLIIRFRKRLIIAFLLLLMFTVIIISKRNTFSRQVNLFIDPSSAVMEPTLLHRYITYQSFWHQFTERPLTGSGWGSREFYWGRTMLYAFWEIRHIRSVRDIDEFGGVNSLFLNNMIKGGSVSLAALLLVIAAVVTASVRALRSRRGILTIGYVVSMGAFLMHELIDNLLHKERISAVFFINLGILIAIGLLGRNAAAGPLGDSSGQPEGTPVPSPEGRPGLIDSQNGTI